MVSIENLKMEFSAAPLFSDVNLVIGDKERIALVGKNGAGKSTLLKILCGERQPTSGIVSIPPDYTIGYLPQVMEINDVTTVREEARKAFQQRVDMKNLIERLSNELNQRDDYESDDYLALVQRFSTEQEHYQLLGAEDYEASIERTLSGLGFRRADLDRPTSEFSGGWRMRIELAKLLLQKPDLLLLDEPTNHLDIESIQWLEQFLLNNGKAVILVSHDRAFLNNLTTRTLEISCGHIVDYKVRYDEFARLRAERRSQQIRAWENQQKEIADMKAFINRFRYQATKAVQVQQKIKQLSKIVPIEIDEIDRSRLRLKFSPCQRSGDYPVICEDVTKRFGQHTVFSNVNLTIMRGEKVAFVGRNGEGKTTLVRCIMGQLPYDGQLSIAQNVTIGYYAQNQAQLLDESITVYDTVDRVATGSNRLRINDILGAFMFGGEESEKKVKVLSGGERSRLAMIRLLLEPVNLLILDEPTNHLDMASKDVLKEAIQAFDGTAIIVSHDREFLDSLVTKVYEFGEGKVKEYLGGIYDWIKNEHPQICGRNDGRQAECHTAGQTVKNEVKSADRQYADRKALRRKISRAERQVKESEQKISDIESKIASLNNLLSTPEGARDMTAVNEYVTFRKMLDEEMTRWEQLSKQLEIINNS